MVVEHGQSPSTVGHVGSGHMNCMRQPLGVHRVLTLAPRALARIKPLFSAVGFFTLRASTMQKLVRSFRPLPRRIAPTDFFKLPLEWKAALGWDAHSIAGSICNRFATQGRPAWITTAPSPLIRQLTNFSLRGVVKRVYSRSSLPGVGRRPSMMPSFWRNGSPPRASA